MCGFDDTGAYFANMDFFEREHPKQAERLQEQEFDEWLEDDEVRQMNREILFRAYPSGDARIAVTVSGHKNIAIYGSLEFVISETVGQYTGLDTDIKSTPIYKDDIIKFDNGNVCFIGRVDKECGAWGDE